MILKRHFQRSVRKKLPLSLYKQPNKPFLLQNPNKSFPSISAMDALYFLKFWSSDRRRPSCAASADYYEFRDDEEDDSFFELELTVPDFDSNKCSHASTATDSNRFDSENHNQDLHVSAGKSELKFPPQSVAFASDKRKILPIESPSSSLNPRSPNSQLKSSPKFRVLMFRKSKSMADHSKKEDSKLFTVKLKLEEPPVFSRDGSLRKQISGESLPGISPKIFSKEVMQKYLKLIKPLYIRISRKQREKSRFSGNLSAASPSSSPATGTPMKNLPAGIRVVCKQLGKSKSASAAVARPLTVSRRDDDGIQSAILHCKKSFNSSSSRDSSLFSRFAGDPLDASPRTSHEES